MKKVNNIDIWNKGWSLTRVMKLTRQVYDR